MKHIAVSYRIKGVNRPHTGHSDMLNLSSNKFK